MKTLISVLALTVFVAACKSAPTAPASDRVAGWRSDLQFLLTEVQRVHPAPFTDPNFSAFKAAISALSAEVPSLTDESVGTGVQRILATVGDGHTSIIPVPTTSFSFPVILLEFYWFDDGVHVVGTAPANASLLGSRVTAIGGMPIDELMTRVAPFVSRDNDMGAKWMATQMMQYAAILRAAGATASDAATVVDLVDPSGAARSITVRADNRPGWQRLGAPGPITSATPRYLATPGIAYSVDSLPADATLYFSFRAVRNDSAETLAAFAARLGDILRQGRFRNLVVDIRQNRGGDSGLLPPLLQELKTFNDASPSNRLFVIAGRGTFSAAQTFATRVEQTTRAVFVGEPTGSRPNHIGDESDIALPYSGLHVSIASRLHQDSSPGDTRTTIAPRIVVPVLARDFFASRDPAFDTVISAIRNGSAPPQR